MKKYKYIIAILTIIFLAYGITTLKISKKPIEKTANASDAAEWKHINDTVGLRAGQDLNNYVKIREQALKNFSQIFPNDTVVGMVSFTDWVQAVDVDYLLIKSKVNFIAVQFSFREAGLGDREIRLEGKSVKEAFQEAVDARRTKDGKANLPKVVNPNVPGKLRNDVNREQEQEDKVIESGKPLIYGLLISGIASEVQKLSDNKIVRLVDVLPATEKQLQHIPLEMRIELKAYRPDYE